MKLKIELSQKTADRLMILYREMDLIYEIRFDQNLCSSCVIGHGIRSGKLNGFSDTHEEFEEAIEWIGLPKLPKYGEDEGAGVHGMSLLESYLFDTLLYVQHAALALQLPRDCGTPKDAQKRIKAVLNAAGYELTWDK